MQVLIDIDENLYKKICSDAEIMINDAKCMDKAGQIRFATILRAIRHGKLLPKGHGRLADMDEAIKCIEEVQGEDAIYAICLIDWACSKRTIIEADTRGKIEDGNNDNNW